MTLIRPTYVRLLDSQFWHVRLGRQSFAQWPTNREPRSTDLFGCDLRDTDNILAACHRSVNWPHLPADGSPGQRP